MNHVLYHDIQPEGWLKRQLEYKNITLESIQAIARTIDAKDEYIMLALRTTRGVVLKEYAAAFGSDFLKDYIEPLHSQADYLDFGDERVRIKDEFLYVQNSIIVEFFN